MEAEAREILSDVCRTARRRVDPERLQALVDELYGSARPSDVVESFLDERRQEAERE
jgi:hypothetical protein